MYKHKKIVCIIPARSGSKGLPGKNIKILLGKPLIAHSIKQARSSRYIDRVIVSTDDKKIATIALRYGAEVPFMRPKSLAKDKSSTIDVLLHGAEWLKKNKYPFDIMVLLHVTAPLRSVKDIDNCIKLLFKKNVSNVISVTPAHRNPYFNMVEILGSRVRLVRDGYFVTRQDTPKVFDLNSSIYVWWIDALKKRKAVLSEKSAVYLMPKERSVDIDDGVDFKLAELLMSKKIKNE